MKKAKKENINDQEFPKDISPMLATLVDEAFDEPNWLYEIKWDGFRSIAYINNGTVELRSRNNKSFNEKFYPLYNSFKTFKNNAVLDGEIVVIDKHGFPDFAALQTWRSEADGDLIFYAFDVLWADGINYMNLPLSERRLKLKELISGYNDIRISESFDVKGKEIFALAEKLKLEGVIAKRMDSLYQSGSRSKDWLKIKAKKHQEAIIGGYTRNENTSKKFSALLMGIYEGNEFVFIGPVGTGFTNKMQEEIIDKLEKYKIKDCPFNEIPEYNKPSRFRPNPPKAEVTWVKPMLVAEIEYQTISPDGSLRHPSFKGLREDKNIKEVKREVEIHTGEILKKVNPKIGKTGIIKGTGLSERRTFLNPSEETQVRNIGGYDLKFSNLSKIFWPGLNVSKRDMLNYYYQIAPLMLPFLKDRPQTLNRFPNGINAPGFYQKDVTGKVPEWMKTFSYYSETDKREKNFLVCTNEASLLYIANLGCIEINPWSSTSENPDNPDWCIIDLDPDKNPFEQVIETARVTKEILDSAGIPSFCKTSGSTGLHIYIPLGGKYSYEDSKEFARSLVKVIHRELPDFTSIERLTSNRKAKIYLDFLQNRPQATVAGPYSLRPKPEATVSMPLHWDEVKKGLKMTDFTIANAVAAARERGNIFEGVLGAGIDLLKSKKLFDDQFKQSIERGPVRLSSTKQSNTKKKNTM